LLTAQCRCTISRHRVSSATTPRHMRQTGAQQIASTSPGRWRSTLQTTSGGSGGGGSGDRDRPCVFAALRDAAAPTAEGTSPPVGKRTPTTSGLGCCKHPALSQRARLPVGAAATVITAPGFADTVADVPPGCRGRVPPSTNGDGARRVGGECGISHGGEQGEPAFVAVVGAPSVMLITIALRPSTPHFLSARLTAPSTPR
jgi:hypothetical protein